MVPEESVAPEVKSVALEKCVAPEAESLVLDESMALEVLMGASIVDSGTPAHAAVVVESSRQLPIFLWSKLNLHLCLPLHKVISIEAALFPFLFFYILSIEFIIFKIPWWFLTDLRLIPTSPKFLET